MLKVIREWFGFAPTEDFLALGNAAGGGHGHTHGTVDPTIATTTRGIWAIKWSFVVLAITSALQLAVVAISGSVALLADTVHNVGDAVTAIPLWVAFMLARRKPSKRFTYGLGRVEDLAGIAIVAIILFSALFAGYEAVQRLIHPQELAYIHWVVAAASSASSATNSSPCSASRSGARSTALPSSRMATTRVPMASPALRWCSARSASGSAFP